MSPSELPRQSIFLIHWSSAWGMTGSYLLGGFLHRNNSCGEIDTGPWCTYPQNSTSDIPVTLSKVYLSSCPPMVVTPCHLLVKIEVCVVTLDSDRRLRDSALPTLLSFWPLPIPCILCHTGSIGYLRGPLPVEELWTCGQTGQLFLP